MKSSETTDLSVQQQVALAYYLLEDVPETLRHGEEVLRQADDYLLGPWREAWHTRDAEHVPAVPSRIVTVERVLDRDACRRRLSWMEPFRDGLLWALCLDHEGHVARLAEYPARPSATAAAPLRYFDEPRVIRQHGTASAARASGAGRGPAPAAAGR